MPGAAARKRTGSRLRARRPADIPPPTPRRLPRSSRPGPGVGDARPPGSRPPHRGPIGGGMTAATDPLIRGIVRDESLTRGLGGVEARMLVEWVVDWAELLAGAARTDADAGELVARLCRRGKAIGRFVHLWDDPRTRG